MNIRRSLRLFAFLFVVVSSSVMCEFNRQIETLEELEDEDATRVAQTVAAIELTRTAPPPSPTETPIPPTPTPSPVPPTPTEVPTSTPDLAALALLALTDSAGDSALCATGNPVDDAAVDILTIDIYDPAAIGSDWTGWLARVGMGVPANTTFDSDWSAALLAAFAPLGSTAFHVSIQQTHAFTRTVGMLDPATGSVVPGTEGSSYIDAMGYVWFQLPAETAHLRIIAFHLPSAEMPDDQKRCDVAPNESAYPLELP